LKNLTSDHFNQLAKAIKAKMIADDQMNGSLGYLESEKT